MELECTLHERLLLSKKSEYIGNNVKKKWNDAKEKLSIDKIKYDDLSKILCLDFYRNFDDMFKYRGKEIDVKLGNIKILLRGVGEKCNNYSRFIPNKKYVSINRFNPKDRVFIYLGVELKDNGCKNNFENVKETCIKELGAYKLKNNNNYVSIMEFIVPSEYTKLKVLDLTIADSYKYDEIISKIYYISSNLKNKEIIKKKINKYLIYIYLKLISDYIFELVETDNAKEKEYEYAPFHVFANYIQNKRYNGIIFRSTRNSSGKNLVLFNPTYVNPKGNIYLYKISGTKSTFIEEVKSVNKNYTIDI
ncbi:hypothetical protein E1H24_17515 [Clostridioides difficile]|uniref:RES domain-containing protein n=1 Tax=Clostridioides TaxID=1870884 RepID=UPI00093C6E69|nr:RES domain-containing protein [Clostridioides difficile]MCC0651188.1 RES family NAD+ phosphorylase [Clostridioides sp. ES-S-0001-03]EGT4823552.1 hypothetical protein [Clostridioides difficile]EGT5244341.1 hypothetical protein [Clostridioides difficile]MBF9871361.1 RES family NAD+ phosphorylase [Clostridioides difficile]MBG0097907.1 RES family NAD+ phosphorylase [Clostridioides difficile]